MIKKIYSLLLTIIIFASLFIFPVHGILTADNFVDVLYALHEEGTNTITVKFSQNVTTTGNVFVAVRYVDDSNTVIQINGKYLQFGWIHTKISGDTFIYTYNGSSSLDDILNLKGYEDSNYRVVFTIEGLPSSEIEEYYSNGVSNIKGTYSNMVLRANRFTSNGQYNSCNVHVDLAAPSIGLDDNWVGVQMPDLVINKPLINFTNFDSSSPTIATFNTVIESDLYIYRAGESYQSYTYKYTIWLPRYYKIYNIWYDIINTNPDIVSYSSNSGTDTTWIDDGNVYSKLLVGNPGEVLRGDISYRINDGVDTTYTLTYFSYSWNTVDSSSSDIPSSINGENGYLRIDITTPNYDIANNDAFKPFLSALGVNIDSSLYYPDRALYQSWTVFQYDLLSDLNEIYYNNSYYPRYFYNNAFSRNKIQIRDLSFDARINMSTDAIISGGTLDYLENAPADVVASTNKMKESMNQSIKDLLHAGVIFESIEKPSIDDTVPDAAYIGNVIDGSTNFKNVFLTILDKPIILQLLTIVFSLATVSFILFGKK